MQIKNNIDFRVTKGYLSNICKKCEIDQAIIRNFKIKLAIINNHYNGHCLCCKKSSKYLPIMEFHHLNPKIKSNAW
ncbi:hypothetical protein LCGC14_1097120 [marine sediment metagenome]|uniref:Uncharacterized protein n=1 Tax=marine sediment metagenome TaxID=412755 RepID=A0A0F9PTS3_9ZZZZ